MESRQHRWGIGGRVVWALTLVALAFGTVRDDGRAHASVSDVAVADVAVEEEPPIVPRIDAVTKARLRAVWLAGRAVGNRAGVFAKVGDSITESGSFLADIGCGAEELGPYRGLTSTVTFFRGTRLPTDLPGGGGAWCGVHNAFTRGSLSATAGWSADDALARLDRPVAVCPAPFDTPLRCELRLLRPSMALIMYGSNDVECFNNPARYRARLTRIVDATLAAGVIPILSTIPPRTDSQRMAARVTAHNRQVIEVARMRRIPLVNFWRAMVDPRMINQGLSEDGLHPSIFGGCAPTCQSATFTDEGLRYGYNQRNLTTLQALAKVKAVVLDNGRPDGTTR